MMWQLGQMFMDIDVRDTVPSVRTPTLVLHRRCDRLVNVRHGRWLAEHLPNARLVELEGDAAWHGEVQEFFTDIVDSTGKAMELGDRRWRELLEGHQRDVRRVLERFHGREVKSTGDGVLATFDGPARAIQCARELIIKSSEPRGIRIRAGLHTGECEVMGDDIGGIAVHIAARVSAHAAAGEVLV